MKKQPKPKAPKTRNAGTWTEARYWSGIRSGLRRLFRFNWEPAKTALLNARRSYKGPNKQQKWEFECAWCHNWFIRKDIELDHVVPCGSLKCLEDVGPFLSRLHPESPDEYAVLCKSCHAEKTEAEREAKET